MKKYFILNTVSLILLLFSACKEEEQLEPELPKVVKVTITGSTAKELEFIYNDNVVASWHVTSGFESKVLLEVSGQDSEITVREKGSTATLNTWNVSSAAFNQTFSIFYDGTAAYDGQVRFRVKGFAMEGELEFLLDGNLLAEGSAKIDQTLPVFINKTEPRQLQVRKKGETTILISKAVNAEPIDGQSLTFLFDGTKIVDNIQIDPPDNPDNMAISAQFTSTFNDPNSNVLSFTGGNKVDLVFYIRKKGMESRIRTQPEPKAHPEIRIPLPTDGTNVSFELPPLANPDEEEYSVDICRERTEEIPYIRGTKALPLFPAINANQGRYGSGIIFSKGSSKVLIIKDGFAIGTTPTPRHYIPIAKITDLSDYFQ